MALNQNQVSPARSLPQAKHQLPKVVPRVQLNLQEHKKQNLVQIFQLNLVTSKEPSQRAGPSILEAAARQQTTERLSKHLAQVFQIQKSILIASPGIVSPLVSSQKLRPHGLAQSHRKKQKSQSKRNPRSKSHPREATRTRRKRRSPRSRSQRKTKWTCSVMTARMKLPQRLL